MAAGGAIHACEVARILQRTHHVTLIVPRFIEDDVRAAYPGLHLCVSPSPAFLARSTIGVQLVSFFSWVRAARQIAGADVVLAASHFLGDIIPLAVMRRVPAAAIVHHVVDPPWRRRGNPVANALHFSAERIGLLLARMRVGAVLTSSHIVGRTLRNLGFRQPLFITVNAPIGPRPEPAARNDAALRVLYLGRLTPTKGLGELLAVWPAVRHRVPGAILDIAGGGDAVYRRRLEETIARLDIADSVIFHGRVNESEKATLLSSAAVFAFPSMEEGFGIVIVEAMAAAVPCVTFDLPIFEELFEKGRLGAPCGDNEAFGALLITLLKDPELRRRIGAEGRATSERYTWERAAAIDLQALAAATDGAFHTVLRRIP